MSSKEVESLELESLLRLVVRLARTREAEKGTTTVKARTWSRSTLMGSSREAKGQQEGCRPGRTETTTNDGVAQPCYGWSSHRNELRQLFPPHLMCAGCPRPRPLLSPHFIRVTAIGHLLATRTVTIGIQHSAARGRRRGHPGKRLLCRLRPRPLLRCTGCSRNYKIEIQEDDVTMHRVASPQGGRD